MALIEQSSMVFAAAVIAMVLTVLVGSVWQAIAIRKALLQAKQQLRMRTEQLAQARADLHGQSVALELADVQRHEKQQQLDTQHQTMTALRSQLNTALKAQTQLETRQSERESKHMEQVALLTAARESLKTEFENLANRIFDDKGRVLTATNQSTLETLLQPFREQLHGFQSRINEVHSESLKGNTALEKEIQRVLEVGLEMNNQANNLTSALKGDKKTAGNWGEAQLERTLELAGLQAGEHYTTQAAYRDAEGKRKLPDVVIKLPNSKSLIIDSKVSLIAYDRAIRAPTDSATADALDAHAAAVRAHINDLAGKNYANLTGIDSPDFVLLFMPIEPAYIAAMKHSKDLFNYGYQKGVILVSHTTLMPILRTVANLWMIEQSNLEAKEISGRAGEVYNQVCLVAERLQKLGNALNTANNYYNEAVTGVAGKQGLYNKIERFAQVSTKADRDMVSLDTLQNELDSDRLQAARTPEFDATLTDDPQT